jgi:hypothetical protein
MQSLLFQQLATARRIFVVGAGGGYDIFSGVPLALHLRSRGQAVVLGNLSFVDLPRTDCAEITKGTYVVTPETRDQAYFPEKFVIDWLGRRGETSMPMIAFSRTIGVADRIKAFRAAIEAYDIDAIVLVDGGTDSLIFGDEPGLGTITEDASSCVAANELGLERAYLACLGFGVDHFHNVSHYAFLENAATMIRDGGFLGTFSLLREHPEGAALLDLVDYANERLPQFGSIVCNSIASAVRGEFGNYHATARTGGSELFINPLMAQYWCFRLRNVVARMHFAEAVKGTRMMQQVDTQIDKVRLGLKLRKWTSIPL